MENGCGEQVSRDGGEGANAGFVAIPSRVRFESCYFVDRYIAESSQIDSTRVLSSRRRVAGRSY